MKNKIIILIAVFGLVISCKSQTITLQQLSECQADLYPCPDYTYAKDTNNLLNKFVGIWKGTYTDGRTYEFHFNKKDDDFSYDKYWDILVGKVLVKNANGQIIFNNLNISDQEALFNGFYFDELLQKYKMSFAADDDCNDMGNIYISFPNPNNLNQMQLIFMQDIGFVTTCPNTYKTVIPDAKPIMLTKQ